MDIDLDNPIGAVIGIFVLIIFGIIAVSILSTMSNIITEDKCKPYQEQISQKDIQIGGLNTQINEVSSQLQQCRGDYKNLIEQNITKKDFEEVKGYFNVTQIQINNLNSRFDQLSENYYSVQNVVINKYNVSIVLNFVFALEILSFVLLKNELAMFLLNLVRKRKKKKAEGDKNA